MKCINDIQTFLIFLGQIIKTLLHIIYIFGVGGYEYSKIYQKIR